jgi:hypothetical protein
MSTDPTNDEVYQNLSLEDFIRHLSPQVSRQQDEIKEINKKGFAPMYDAMFKETAPPKEEVPLTRQERRKQEHKQRKAERKKKNRGR